MLQIVKFQYNGGLIYFYSRFSDLIFFEPYIKFKNSKNVSALQWPLRSRDGYGATIVQRRGRREGNYYDEKTSNFLAD